VSGVVIEPVGDDVVVMTPGNSQVLRLNGTSAELVKRVINGESIDAPSEDVINLIQSGVLEMSGGMSRRGLITAGAVGVGAGMSMLAMPSAAMAASIQRIPLTGGWVNFGSPPPEGEYAFEINTYDGRFTFPDPLPSNDVDDVSPLRILGETISVDYHGFDPPDNRFIGWGYSFLPNDPPEGVTGEFEWANGDGTFTYYTVTFISFYPEL
jgi:hypothetical protein